MNIVLMVGNGFDIAQGAKTRYTDFYEEYKYCTPVNNVEKRMIEDITGEKAKTWADLEKKLGEYTKDCSDAEAFTGFYLHLVAELQKYLKTESAVHSMQKTEKFLLDIREPDKYFTPAEERELREYFGRFSSSALLMTAISFNYTSLFEDSIGFKEAPVTLKNRFVGSPFVLNQVYKIHGRLGSTALLGVNDASQILNTSFSKNQDLLDVIVKPESNKVIGSLVDESCHNEISHANLLILHGLSLGDTDKIWWERIGQRLMSHDNVRILYFLYIKDYDISTRGFLQGRYKRKAKKNFFDACNIPEEKREELENKVYISINSDFLVLTK